MNESRELISALRDANWEELLPRLVAYAERRLRRAGWARGLDHQPSAMEAQELVNKAIEKCLNGERLWSDDAPDLEIFLCGVIKSLCSSARKSAVRSRVMLIDDAGANAPSGLPPADEALAERGRSEILEAFAASIKGDEELEDLHRAILEGHTKREQIAEALQWSVERVSAARVKLQRRLVARFPALFADITKRRAS